MDKALHQLGLPGVQQSRWHWRRLLAPVVTIALLGMTFLYWAQEEEFIAESRRHNFAMAADRTGNNLRDRMAAYELVLRGVKGYFDGSEQIDHQEFHAYVDALQLPATRPGLQGVSLLLLVPRGRLNAHVADLRRRGFHDYALWPDGDRGEYAPVTYIEPMNASNMRALGFDPLASPITREAMERARDSGDLALTGQVDLAQDGTRGHVMYVPLYRGGLLPATEAERRRNIVGWVSAPFRLTDVVQGLLQEFDVDVALEVYDATEPTEEARLYAAAPGAIVGQPETQRLMDVGGRSWRLAMHPMAGFNARFSNDSHHIVALLGVLMSLLAGWFIAVQGSRYQRAVALAASMTGQLRHTRDELEGTLNAIPDLLFELDPTGCIHHYRSARANVLSVPPEAFISHRLHEILPAPAVVECMAALREAESTGYSAGRQFGLQVGEGYRWFELSVARKDGIYPQQRFIALARDITSRRQAEDSMHRLAYFDTLTGLPNRRSLLDTMQSALETMHREGAVGGLFYIDLDNFKQINDARGHTVGDRLLVQTAQRLTRLRGPADAVARLGGDEFVVLVARLGYEPEAARLAAMAVAMQLRDTLDVPYTLDSALYSSTGSIGVTMFPKDGEGVEDLLREADTAMYCAKDLGRNRVCFFEAGMQANAQERLALEQDLKQAVADDALEVYVQSQVDGAGVVVGGELLLRWQHPVRGAVPPTRFIPVAESSGLILRIGARVIRQACELIAALHERGRGISLSVNVSQRQFRQDDFVASVRTVLSDTGAPPSLLILEVTESLLVEDWEGTVRRMTELVDLGVRFSIDDFGTGYSSLAYLKKLPLYELKIDKSFVQDTPHDPNDTAIVQAILSAARHLKLRVVAEGVETREQAAFLTACDCDCLQGYLFSRPAPLTQWRAERLRE